MKDYNSFSWATTSEAFKKAREDGLSFVKVGLEICTKCGNVHRSLKTCNPRKRTRHRAHAEMRSEQDLEVLDIISNHNGFETFTKMCRHIVDSAYSGRARIVIDLEVGDLLGKKGTVQESITHK